MGILDCKECKECFPDNGDLEISNNISQKISYGGRENLFKIQINKNMNNVEKNSKNDERKNTDIIPQKIKSKESKEMNRNYIDSYTYDNKNKLKNNDIDDINNMDKIEDNQNDDNNKSNEDKNSSNNKNKIISNNKENNNNKEKEIKASLPEAMDVSSEMDGNEESYILEEDENDNNN